MIQRLLIIACLFVAQISVSQTLYEQLEEKIEKENDTAYSVVKNDSLTYQKDLNTATTRTFDENPKDKYTGKAFEYVDDVEKPKPKEEPTPVEKNSDVEIGGFISLLGAIFPYVLGLIVVLIIVKSIVDTKGGLWSFKRGDKKVASKEIFQQEEENIHENDYEKRLQLAIQNKDYRLATRYYYLSVLKTLAEKKLITYHIEKTNTDYLFEIKNKKTRKEFSHVSYIYEYVWYGEFELDDAMFGRLQNKFNSFINNLN